jgi:hypothetical protein
MISLFTVNMLKIAGRNPAVLIGLFILLINWMPANSQSMEGSFISKFKFSKKQESFTGKINTKLFEVAWKGERMVNQLMLWTTSGQFNDLDYQLTDLTGVHDTISASDMNLKFVTYVRADQKSRPCSEYGERNPVEFDELGDALTTRPWTSLSPNNPIRIWLTINIPFAIDSGIYCGSLQVNSAGKMILSFPVQVRVTDWQIPAREDWVFHLDLWQYPARVIDRYNEDNPDALLNYWSDDHYSMLRQMYTILADKGQKAITAHIKEGALGCPSMVKWIRSADSTWHYDFDVFDQYVDSMMKWGIREQINCHSPVGWNSDEIPYLDESSGMYKTLNASIGSLEYTNRWNDFLDHFKQHLESKSWFEKAVLCLDEIPENQLNFVINMIKGNHPDWKIGMAGFHQPSPGTVAEVYDLSLMYNIPNGNMDQNKVNTFYFSCNPPFPNNFVATDAKAAGNTFIGWYAQSKNLTGFLRWAFDDWLENRPDEMRTGAHTSGDFCLIYRSSNKKDMEFLSSIRLELIREGIQDFEKINILKDRLSHSSEPDDEKALQLLRLKLDEFKSVIVGPDTISALVESGQKLIRDIISGNVSQKPATEITNNILKKDSEVTVYPDFSSHTLQIETHDNEIIREISLVDLSGHTVYSRYGIHSGKYLVDINALAYGMYFLIVKGNGKDFMEKILIKR